MRIIMSGGGTGGHIYPAITIANAIKKLHQSTEIIFVGTPTGMEADIVPREGFHFTTIQVRGFERKFTVENIKTALMAARSLWESYKIIKNFRPDIVIGTGGYVCGPVLLAASILGVRTMIQEQNAIPGVTNRILARFVDKIAVGYQESVCYFSRQEKIVFTGNPIRPEIMEVTREDGLKRLGLKSAKTTILVVGGSRGARRINSAIIPVAVRFLGDNDIQILHVTGKSEYNNIVGIYKQQGIDVTNNGNIMVKPYLYNMPDALAVSDLAIFRAGALGLAELTARGIPSILIPYPFAAENHQEYNAKVIENHGAALVIHDKDLDGQILVSAVEKLVFNKPKLLKMAEASKKLGRPQAAEDIAKLALSIVNR